MINTTQEIVDKLRTVYPSEQYDIYTECIEQGFSAPCFSIRQLRADVTPYPSGLHEIVQHMDVRFFPSDSRPQEQCRETAQTLTLLLRRTESLRGSNLSWEITDEVLHFFADYRQFVREIPEDIPMENLQTTVGTENENGSQTQNRGRSTGVYRRTAPDLRQIPRAARPAGRAARQGSALHLFRGGRAH